jgi:hypothetical protein
MPVGITDALVARNSELSREMLPDKDDEPKLVDYLSSSCKIIMLATTGTLDSLGSSTRGIVK